MGGQSVERAPTLVLIPIGFPKITLSSLVSLAREIEKVSPAHG
jgi:hypothetical protein